MSVPVERRDPQKEGTGSPFDRAVPLVPGGIFKKRFYDGTMSSAPKDDPVNHPHHYTSHPSGVECITITEHMTFNAGNAVKYLWRAGLKQPRIDIVANGQKHLEDLRKAAWYVTREVERLEKELLNINQASMDL